MSSATVKPSKTTARARVQAFIAGTKKHFPSSTITLGNTAYETASLVELFQSLVDAIAATDEAHASTKDTVTVLRGVTAKVGPVLLAYKRWLLTTYGTATQTLADFGVSPPKARTPRTGEQNAAAAAKRLATRKARGIVGKKKRLAVKGDVTGVVMTPVRNAGGSTPSASPAEAAPKPAVPGSPSK